MIKKFFKNLIIETWYDPQQGFELIKLLSGTLISGIIGMICVGSQECGKIMLDKIRKD